MSDPFPLCLRLKRTGEILAPRVRLASTFWKRFAGLLGTDGLAPGEGLLLVPCNSVHTVGMRYAIDVVYLSSTGSVLKIHHAMPPGTFSWPVRGARAVLELPAGTLQCAKIEPGDQVLGLPS